MSTLQPPLSRSEWCLCWAILLFFGWSICFVYVSHWDMIRVINAEIPGCQKNWICSAHYENGRLFIDMRHPI